MQAGQSLTLQFVKPNGKPVRVEAMVWRVDADMASASSSWVPRPTA